jgi:glycosyltransferase involved in cell wall biosynthesis
MKIISYTMVNNESEIIESFIRYNYNFVDEMVIVDNGCTDNTIKIINNLISEGYQITVYDESLETYNQFELDNKYINLVIDELEPDIVVPLDADEFITADGDPRTALESLSLNTVYYVHWQWYVLSEIDCAEEPFIPKRLGYRLKQTLWYLPENYITTKTILPAMYFKKKNLTLSMGHHTVFGNGDIETKNIENIHFAHYRIISKEQFIYKTMCYTVRDIATLGNNVETSQRTNQMAQIEAGHDMQQVAIEASYCGYPKMTEYAPINLEYCKKSSINVRYSAISKEKIESRILDIGREMAIRNYNFERNKREKPLMQKILLVMDGEKGTDYISPSPTNNLVVLTELFNVRGYITTCKQMRFLKVNFRLIVTPDIAKFLPYSYIVVPNTVNYSAIKEKLIQEGINQSKIISIDDYKKQLGFLRMLYCYLLLIPSIIIRIQKYIKRNGIRHAMKKIKERLS